MPSHRLKGLGMETAQGLVSHAFSHPGVHKVIAHTLAEENASVHILQKIGFRQTEDVLDHEEGPLWLWELPKK